MHKRFFLIFLSRIECSIVLQYFSSQISMYCLMHIKFHFNCLVWAWKLQCTLSLQVVSIWVCNSSVLCNCSSNCMSAPILHDKHETTIFLGGHFDVGNLWYGKTLRLLRKWNRDYSTSIIELQLHRTPSERYVLLWAVSVVLAKSSFLVLCWTFHNLRTWNY